MGMRQVLSLLSAAVLLLPAVSCADDAEVMSELDAAESVMEDSPETALALLDTMQRSRLVSRKAAARHALLYSQALDKNYIDMTTDSIIRPAAEYYSRHGSADERLKAQYYLGCIYRNLGDSERAMECYVRAERYVDRAEDYRAVGRLYSAKRKIYFDYYDLSLSYAEAMKSEHYYKLSGDSQLRAKALINAALSASILNYNHIADSILSVVRDSLWNVLGPDIQGSYYSVFMTVAEERGDTAQLKNLLDEHLKHTEFYEGVPWGTIVRSYLFLNKIDSAKWALERYSIEDPQHDTSPQYLLLASEVYSKNGEFDKGYYYLEKYKDVVGVEDMMKFNSDTKFIEERYEYELSSMRQRNIVWLSVLGLTSGLFAVMSLLLVMRYRLKRKEYELEITALKVKEAEDKNLRLEQKAQLELIAEENKRKELEEINSKLESEKVILETMLKETSLSSKAEEIISDRLSTVVQVFARTASGQGDVDDYVRGKMEELMADKDEFVLTTMMSYAAVHSEFVKYLKGFGLTDWEVGYCSFYTMGLKGKDIGNMLNNGGHTHHNRASLIRTKLGLKERDGHLGRFLMKKLRETEERAQNEV